MRMKKLISILLSLGLVASLAGCSNAEVVVDTPDAVTLVEPVNAAVSSEVAAHRNLYSNTVYSAYILPYVVEYSFDENVTFDSYGAFPGEKVKKGDVLIYSDSEKIEDQIEKMEEKIKAQEESHAEYLEDTAEEIIKLMDAANYWKDGKESYDALGDKTYAEAGITEWEYTQLRKASGYYATQAHKLLMKQQEQEQNIALYELDHNYNLSQLKKLQAQSKECKIIADMDGYVVSITGLSQGNNISKDQAVVAVGDTTKKIIKCDYINKSTAEKAEEMYAFIDGKRYEVEYQPMDTEEYNRLTAQSEKIYTTFIVNDPDDEIAVGDFAVINVMDKRKLNVLSVSKEAIQKDENGYYVFKYQDGESVHTPIKTGMSDGVYTEVLEGLQAGDVVLCENAHQPGTKKATVGKGTFSADVEVRGSLGYPASTLLKNEIAYGTAYFVEFLVDDYQLVKKGDPLMTVRVEEDALTLERKEKQLQRAQERLADFVFEGEDKVDEEVLADKKEAIADIEEDIAEIKADFATTTIKADRDGVIVWMADLEEDDIMWNGQYLFYIADEENCYVEVTNENFLLNYGNQVNISYENRQEQNITVPGTVANISQLGLSSDLHLESALILIPSEYLTDMASSLWGGMNNWWNRNRFTVTADVRVMENVVVIPRNAVRSVGGKTYVDVVDEKGNVVSTSFIAGGFDASNYWVIEGIEEGMEICLE
ncbi:MAG: hypothetical protein IJ327_01230 [Lachnospiraceae bacterium]|nr:hypothetical protein [Lachnospiraceae bacterium]